MGTPGELRFADFEVSLRSGELRRNGLKIKLQQQPFQILVLLLEHHGEVVKREEIRQKLWTADTFVDFDNGLNIAVKKLRTALDDDPDTPRYIETLPRRGYRFIAPVTSYEFRAEGSSDIFDAILPATSTTPEEVKPGASLNPKQITGHALQDDRGFPSHDSGIRPDLRIVERDGSGSVRVKAPASTAIGATRRPTVKLIGVATLIAIFAGATALGAYKLLNSNILTPDARNITIRPLTDDGKAVAGIASISSDGNLLAYVRREGERNLRVKQVATGSEVTVVPTRAGFFDGGATFTPNGNYLYYTHQDLTNAQITNLYDVPSLGGKSRLIVADVASGVTFSPDGKRMAYMRLLGDKGEEQLIVANVDGSNEQVILRRESMETMINNPSWSVSNNLIAVGAPESKPTSIVVLTPQGKVIKTFPLPLRVADVAWAPGLSGLFFIGDGKSTGGRPQIWFQPYPDGPPLKISNDLSRYESLSVTADGQSFVTSQKNRAAAIYVGDSPATLNDKIDWRLSLISDQHAPGYDISWTPGGKLLQQDGTHHVYETAGDGSGRVDLLDNDEIATAPASCGSDDEVVLTRILDHKPSVWRLNVVTGGLRQLTFGRADQISSCTPDGKWVVYQGSLPTDSVEHIFKVSIDGGTPVELAHGNLLNPAVSPDGKLVVYMRADGQGAGRKFKFVVQKLEGGTPVREFQLPTIIAFEGWQTLGWTPDGHALTYVNNTTGNTQNVYMQPLEGGPAVQLTHFDSEPGLIVGYGWSRDGKKFAITRARYNDTDIVMFSNFK